MFFVSWSVEICVGSMVSGCWCPGHTKCPEFVCIVRSMAELWVIIERLHFTWLHYKRIFRVKVRLSTISFRFFDYFNVCRCWFDVNMHVFAYLFPNHLFCHYFRPEIWMTRLSGTSIWCQRSTTIIVLQISEIRLLSVFVGVFSSGLRIHFNCSESLHTTFTA